MRRRATTTWHVNKAHYLETWSDARAYDGTDHDHPADDRAAVRWRDGSHEVFQGLLDNPQMTAYDAVVANAEDLYQGRCERRLAEGAARRLGGGHGVYGGLEVAGRLGRQRIGGFRQPSSGGLEIAFKADPSLFDGRYANVGWLQELPKQVTSMSWDNAALVSTNTQLKLGIAENEAIELERQRPQGDCADSDGSRPPGRCGDGVSGTLAAVKRAA